MKRLLICILLVCLITLISCDSIKWVKIEGEDTQIDSEGLDEEFEEEAKETAKSIWESIMGSDDEEEVEQIVSSKEDRVDVKLGLDVGEVTGTIDGITKSFTVPYDDKDAIIFDIAKEWEKKVKDIRHLTYFNGQPYSTKAIQQKQEEVVKEMEKNVTSFNPETIPYLLEYETGIVRGIGCDFERGLLKLRLANEFQEDLPMYREVIPRIKGALVVYLNNKVIELSCVESIAPGEIIECIKANLQFAAAKQSSVVSDEAEFDLVDVLAIYKPGMNDQFPFRCVPKEG